MTGAAERGGQNDDVLFHSLPFRSFLSPSLNARGGNAESVSPERAVFFVGKS